MKFISTAGHGYLVVTHKQLIKAMKKGFKPTCSLLSKSSAFLEEDLDAGSFLETLYGADYKNKVKINVVCQNDIKKDKYLPLYDTIEKVEHQIAIATQKLQYRGKKMITFSGKEYKILGIQSNGYIFKDDDGLWCMPYGGIEKIV